MPPEYLTTARLTELVPSWTPDAIEKKINRKLLVRGVHYFQPDGRRRQRLFKWSAIVAMIEAPDTSVSLAVAQPAPVGAEVHDVEEAASRIRRLLRSSA